MSAPTDAPLSFEGFCQQLLLLLDEGRFVATYKFAVLIGLLDVLAEHVGPEGQLPDTVGTRELARAVTELYWPHSLPFADADAVLRQNSQGQAVIVRLIKTFRETTVGDATLPLSAARAAQPTKYLRLLRAVEAKLVEMPLGKLQLVGTTYTPFIYTLDWDRGQPPRQGDVTADSFDGRLTLQQGAAEHLLRAAPLIRPLIQRTWALTISRFNSLGDSELDAFLFGADRISLAPVSEGLRSIHAGRCFYCQRRVTAGWQIDHFIPWTRRIDNGLANLVFACTDCNNAKRAFLAAGSHVERWMARLTDPTSDVALGQLAAAMNWTYDPRRTVAAARGIYLPLPDTYMLWAGKGLLESVEAERIHDALALIA